MVCNLDWPPGRGLAAGIGPRAKDPGELMESAEGEGPAGAAGAPASKKDKKGSKNRSRRRWRKVKTKGERAGPGNSPEGTLDIAQGIGD